MSRIIFGLSKLFYTPHNFFLKIHIFALINILQIYEMLQRPRWRMRRPERGAWAVAHAKQGRQQSSSTARVWSRGNGDLVRRPECGARQWSVRSRGGDELVRRPNQGSRLGPPMGSSCLLTRVPPSTRLPIFLSSRGGGARRAIYFLKILKKGITTACTTGGLWSTHDY